MGSELSLHTIAGDYLDTLDYEGSKEIEAVRRVLESGRSVYEHAEELYHDIFMLLHTISPQDRMVPPSRIDESVMLNRRIIEELSRKDMVNHLRLQNGGLYFISAIGAVSILDTVLKWLEESNGANGPTGEGERGRPDPEEILRRLEDPGACASMENLISKGLERANIKISKEKETVEAIERALGNGMSEELKYEIAQRMSNEKCFALIVGMMDRLRSVAHDARRKKFNKERSINRGYEYSNDLERTLPVEMALLRSEASKPLFYKKYHDGKLQCIKYQRRDNRKLGPIIACIDNSGSMEGMPEAYSKALMILLYEQAIRQKRQFVVLHFSSKDQIERFDFDIGRKDHDKMIGAIEFYAGGGTDFESPLRAALGIVTDWQCRDTDLIFVSDGFSEVPPHFLEEFLERKRELDVNVLAVGIREGAWKRHTLESFSDYTIALPDISDESLQNKAVEELFINMK